MALPDVPPSPGAKIFIQPKLNIHCFCVMGLQHRIDVEALKSAVSSSPVMQIRRMCSLVVLDKRTGAIKGWKRLPSVDLNRHFVVVPEGLMHSEGESEVDAVNQYVADLASSRSLATDKPLWEIHVLVAHRCIVWCVHHAISDGVSFMSMLQACFTEAAHEEKNKTAGIESGRKDKKRKDKLSDRVRGFWYDTKFILKFVLKSALVADPKTAIKGGAGVELWPTKLASATFLIEDMKLVKLAVPNATINDVLFTVISSGLGRYLKHRSPKGIPNRLRITGVTLANLREKGGYLDLSDMMNESSKSRWGNLFGYLHLPVRCHEAVVNPLEYLKSARVMLERKKKSSEARFSFNALNFIQSLFGAKFATQVGYKMLCNTTFLISNMVGPKEEMAIAGNPVAYLKTNLSSTPHSLTMHMVSYKGKGNLQILAAKDIIPDPEFLAKCFEDALFEMKEAALATKDASQASRETV